MSTFNLDYEYDLYLSRVGLEKRKMDPSHRRETKRAFMGGAGSVLAMLVDIVDMNEADAMAVLSRIRNDVA